MATMVGLLLMLVFGSSLINAAPRLKRQTSRGPLYDYVHSDDGMFSYTELFTATNSGVATYLLNVTSQQWYDETFTDRPVWWHYVVVHIPENRVYQDSAFFLIDGGSNDVGPPGMTDSVIQATFQMALSTGMVTGAVKQIPNQPIIMGNDGVPRREDDYIAWTWRRFYDEKHAGIDNPEVLARMPMCKGAVRAMDALQMLVKEKVNADIENFVIAGASKRGWTAWLTAAIDDRVIGVAPVVLSCLNMIDNFHHYYKSMGAWSFALFDYWNHGIMALIDEPEMLDMSYIIDPYYYRQYLTMPNLMISGASDEFFMPDDYDYFYKDLTGDKYIWIIENSGHGVDEAAPVELQHALETFTLSVLENHPRPTVEWTKEYTSTGGSIVMTSDTAPLSVSAFSAISISPDRRDWRLHLLDGFNAVRSNVTWIESPVQDLGNSFRVEFENPSSGYLAFYIKAVFSSPGGRFFPVTTDAAVVPNNFPYPDCSGFDCFGSLI